MLPVALGLFFCDFLTFGLFDQWVTFGLLAYTVLKLGSVEVELNFKHYIIVFLFLLQDFIITGRAGLALVYLIPAILASRHLQTLFRGSLLPYLLAFILSLMGYLFSSYPFFVGLLYVLIANLLIFLIIQ